MSLLNNGENRRTRNRFQSRAKRIPNIYLIRVYSIVFAILERAKSCIQYPFKKITYKCQTDLLNKLILYSLTSSSLSPNIVSFLTQIFFHDVFNSLSKIVCTLIKLPLNFLQIHNISWIDHSRQFELLK